MSKLPASDFYRRLDEKESENRINRIFADRPENLHDYPGCANDTNMVYTPPVIADGPAEGIATRRTCTHCDFGSGRRGMDRCAKCDGKGWIPVEPAAPVVQDIDELNTDGEPEATHTTTNCKSDDGIIVSLIDGIIAVCRVLQPSLETIGNEAILEAYKDLRSDGDVQRVMGIHPQQAEWLKIQCDMVVDMLGKKYPALAEVESLKASQPTPVVVSQDETTWNPYQQVLRYEARRVLDPINDPDCVQAWRNGHGSIDLEQRDGCGQVAIFSLRRDRTQIEAGDWIIKWAGNENGHHWVETDSRTRAMFKIDGVSTHPAPLPSDDASTVTRLGVVLDQLLKADDKISELEEKLRIAALPVGEKDSFEDIWKREEGKGWVYGPLMDVYPTAFRYIAETFWNAAKQTPVGREETR